MKLVHCNLTHQILLKEYGVTQWIIENPSQFGAYVQELYLQTEGAEGRFVLSDEDKELAIAKKVDMIMNPLLVDINNKKVLNKLYQELSETAYSEDRFLETQQMLNQMQNYFYQLEQDSEYMLEMEPEISLTELLKAMGVHIIKMEEDYFTNLIQYIKIVSGLLEKPLVVIVNAMAYLSKEQVSMLHETAVYAELRVLFIESEKRELDFKVNQYIIDMDICEI